MKGSGDGDLKIAISDAFLNMVQRTAEICSNGWPSGDMLKRMAPVDSAHQIGLAALLIDVLTVDEGVSRWRFKNRQIGHVVHYSSTTRPRACKRRMALKSARQIGVSTISKDVLTVDKGVCGCRFKISKSDTG